MEVHLVLFYLRTFRNWHFVFRMFDIPMCYVGSDLISYKKMGHKDDSWNTLSKYRTHWYGSPIL